MQPKTFKQRRRDWGRASRVQVLVVAVLAVAIAVVSGCGSAGASTTKKSSANKFGATLDAKIAAQLPAKIKASGTLTSINYNNSPPASFLEGSTLVGWNVDLGQAVATTLGLKFKPTVSGSFAIFIPGLQNGRFETANTGLVITSAREQQISLVSVFRVGTGFVTKAGSGVKIAKEQDLCGRTIAALVGSAFVTSIASVNSACTSAGKTAPTVNTYPDNASAQLAVQSGRAAAFADTADELGYLAKKDKQFTLQTYQFSPVLEGIGVSNTVKLAKPIAAAMNHLIQTGVYAKIMHSWGITSGLLTKAQINPSAGS